MARREIDVDGAGPQAVRTGPQADPHASPGAAGDGAGRAASRYLDAWDANQSEVSRLGPQGLPGVPPGGFGR